jgi:hypothetical protein
METWVKSIPNLEIVIINHENLSNWIDDSQWVDSSVDIERFKRLDYMFQSDIASELILTKHGGIFMDADTIITKDIFDDINKFDPDTLIAFGYPDSRGIHVAILIALNPKNHYLSLISHEAVNKLNKLSFSEEALIWDYFSNSIFKNVDSIESNRKHLQILDRHETGNILESHYFVGLHPMEQYVRFYFKPHKTNIKETLKKVKFGAISLHNSFTPEGYKKLTREQVLEDKSFMLSKILKHILID